MITPISGVLAPSEVHDHFWGYDDRTYIGVGQTHSFYSNYSNVFYAFWGTEHGGIAAYDYVWVYMMSYDGVTWFGRNATSSYGNFTYLPSDAGISNTIEYDGLENADFYLSPNGSILYSVFLDTLHGGAVPDVNYRVYDVLSNGRLSLRIEEMDIALPVVGAIDEPINCINVVVDNESRPYIAAEYVDATNTFNNVWIHRGSYTNGSWISHTSRNSWLGDITGSAVDELFYVDLFNTGDGKTRTGIGRGVSMLVHWDNVNGIGENLDTDLAINYYDGAGWDVDGLGALGMEDNEGDWNDRIVWMAQSGNISAIVVQTENFGGNLVRLEMAFKEGKNSWQNNTVLSFNIDGDGEGANRGLFDCAIGMDNQTDFVVVWVVCAENGGGGNETMWYRRGNALQIMENATWTWQTDIVEWQTIPEPNIFDSQSFHGGQAGGNGFTPYNVPLTYLWQYDTNGEVWIDWIFTESNGGLSLPAEHLNSTLYDHLGNVVDEWIFEGEVYDLVSYIDNATSFYVNTTDGRHNIEFHWNNATEELWIDVDPSDQFTVGLASSEFERTGTITRLLWRFIPDRNILDSEDNQWDYFIENSDMNYNASATLGFTTNIYNLGGFTYYTFTGDGGRVVGGHPFEIYATNGTEGSSARAEQIYRKLQHSHFLIEIDMDNEWDGASGEFDIDAGIGFVDIGIDYLLNGTWELGHYVRLYVQDSDVGHHNLGNDHDWIEWSVDWYNYNPTAGSIQNIASDLIYSNHWGYDNENLTPDYHNRTSAQLWVDLWFDRTNASTTIAGQVNAMYHGMREHGSSWWFGYGDFQPMKSDYGNALFLDDLYDEGRNVTDSLKFDLMRLFVEVGKVADADGDDETWTITAIENFNRKYADDRMQGIDQPAFEETLVLDMPMFQSMNPLIRAIDGISRSIWQGALGFQKILWGAMDTFFQWVGFGEGFFSRITAFVLLIPEIFTTIMENLAEAMVGLVEYVDDVFTMVVQMLPEFVIGMGWLTETILDYWGIIADLFNGTLLPFSIIQDLQLGDWIRFGIALLPTWEMFSIIFDNDPARKLKERVEFYSSLFNGTLNFLRGLIVFLQGLVGTIMDILPL